MKYKVGDKVKIKTWKKMEKEYGLDALDYIKCKSTFVPSMEECLNEVNRTVEIKEVLSTSYIIVEDGGEWSWSDDMITTTVVISLFPTNKRFKIMDIE